MGDYDRNTKPRLPVYPKRFGNILAISIQYYLRFSYCLLVLKVAAEDKWKVSVFGLYGCQ